MVEYTKIGSKLRKGFKKPLKLKKMKWGCSAHCPHPNCDTCSASSFQDKSIKQKGVALPTNTRLPRIVWACD